MLRMLRLAPRSVSGYWGMMFVKMEEKDLVRIPLRTNEYRYFLANISHELRTPLGAMLGFALSDDGARVWLGGLDDGVHHAGGVELIIASAFRSDAEQARLFAQHPDPKWVAPPGRSLHRLGTELDLGALAVAAGLRIEIDPQFVRLLYSTSPLHDLVRDHLLRLARRGPDADRREDRRHREGGRRGARGVGRGGRHSRRDRAQGAFGRSLGRPDRRRRIGFHLSRSRSTTRGAGRWRCAGRTRRRSRCGRLPRSERGD